MSHTCSRCCRRAWPVPVRLKAGAVAKEMHQQHCLVGVRLTERCFQRRVRHRLGRVYQQSWRGLAVHPDRRAPARPVHQQQIPQFCDQPLLWTQRL